MAGKFGCGFWSASGFSLIAIFAQRKQLTRSSLEEGFSVSHSCHLDRRERSRTPKNTECTGSLPLVERQQGRVNINAGCAFAYPPLCLHTARDVFIDGYGRHARVPHGGRGAPNWSLPAIDNARRSGDHGPHKLPRDGCRIHRWAGKHGMHGHGGGPD
uniref:Uncharacterized protein n=1 Tax=Candidatus Kentrum sp. SD TaxID=2126332 RepID=A0A451BPT2_9GAMM|nr:MAG: hypothetical protein BECKSD772F_GA0070984_11028 [Candidatus Kentron sp. SD]VFK47648.1 MAG: hypothetical protein BECKSD772E_GA0070983_11018 [Candidatus Kentron sp. SD]VFK80296.1 MAG: hypothetical protein BECKSD772D_GA0070982_11006 [Candidatus Kentron sp. SD]